MRPWSGEGGRSGSGVPDWMPSRLLPKIGLFLDAPGVTIGRVGGEIGMDDLTAQEQELILTLRYLKSFSVIVHRNEGWRIILAEHDAGRTEVGEGLDFESAWVELSGKRSNNT